MTAEPTPARARKTRGATRPKHVPQRMCVACRLKDAKRQYVRIVRTPEGLVEVDPTGKANGRGAYLCQRRACWQRALETGALGKALNVQIDSEAREVLSDYARSHFPPDEN